ncbi:hypothetical protein DUNSADRAFT_13226 [Dunaliella salina]|uniref:Uncharacterized protein n=1 Tax=Dunaliella salina TaxID=3046 RepID=A0ABQ7H3B2_DUNSA|nr:hypothetical protein DUNSADRAFT_13226 [Dunaliella salina]|eukprot:KAF5841358.1 hypothetical protein DUNSADRAFT_13226 [Dunaliella salina]
MDIMDIVRVCMLLLLLLFVPLSLVLVVALPRSILKFIWDYDINPGALLGLPMVLLAIVAANMVQPGHGVENDVLGHPQLEQVFLLGNRWADYGLAFSFALVFPLLRAFLRGFFLIDFLDFSVHAKDHQWRLTVNTIFIVTAIFATFQEKWFWDTSFFTASWLSCKAMSKGTLLLYTLETSFYTQAILFLFVKEVSRIFKYLSDGSRDSEATATHQHMLKVIFDHIATIMLLLYYGTNSTHAGVMFMLLHDVSYVLSKAMLHNTWFDSFLCKISNKLDMKSFWYHYCTGEFDLQFNIALKAVLTWLTLFPAITRSTLKEHSLCKSLPLLILPLFWAKAPTFWAKQISKIIIQFAQALCMLRQAYDDGVHYLTQGPIHLTNRRQNLEWNQNVIESSPEPSSSKSSQSRMVQAAGWLQAGLQQVGCVAAENIERGLVSFAAHFADALVRSTAHFANALIRSAALFAAAAVIITLLFCTTWLATRLVS